MDNNSKNNCKELSQEPLSFNSSETYESRFIRSANIKAKTGKTIYLRPEYHLRVARILQLLEENTISLTDYVDNVFAHHFAQFEQEIREFCLKNNDPII